MNRFYKLENLDCAHCAEGMERAINKLDCVKSATVSFMLARLVIEAEDELFEKALDEAQKAISGVNRKTKIVR